jgi:hypothetical protein
VHSSQVKENHVSLEHQQSTASQALIAAVLFNNFAFIRFAFQSFPPMALQSDPV